MRHDISFETAHFVLRKGKVTMGTIVSTIKVGQKPTLAKYKALERGYSGIMAEWTPSGEAA